MTRESSTRRARPQPALALAMGLACTLLPACGPSLYTFQILPASAAVHQAEEAGAAEHAAFEYWTAHEYLDKAAEEANEGNYSDATRFAERANQMARAAQERTGEVTRERAAAAHGER